MVSSTNTRLLWTPSSDKLIMCLKAGSTLWPGTDIIPKNEADQEPKMSTKQSLCCQRCQDPNLQKQVYFYDFGSFIP